MATLTKDQQVAFDRAYLCFCGLFTNEDMDQAKRVFYVMTAWRNDEDKTFLPRMLEKFLIARADQQLFLNWVELKTQSV